MSDDDISAEDVVLARHCRINSIDRDYEINAQMKKKEASSNPNVRSNERQKKKNRAAVNRSILN